MPLTKKRANPHVRVVRSKTPLKVLLLVAGRSTRFWPLREKTLYPFLGRPLLHHQVERLRAAGFADITFVGGEHNLTSVRKQFPGIPVIEQEDLMLGMRGAMLSALPTMGDSPVLIVSSNDLIEANGYASLLTASQKSDVDGAILAQRVSQHFPGGYLTVKPWPTTSGQGADPEQSRRVRGGRITGIVEKPEAGKEPSDLVNIVAHVHKHPQKLLERLKETASTRDDAYEVALDSLFSELHYAAVPYEGTWNAMKYPWHVLPIMGRFLATLRKQEIHRSSEISKHASIEGPVILGPNVKVLAHATVKGPCVIGSGTLIGSNSLVRNSMVGSNGEIGFGCEVARSHLGDKVIAHRSYIGDSVVASDVNFGAGSVTANLRLDEGNILSFVKGEKVDTTMRKLGAMIGSGARIGVNVSIAPGVKIGQHSFISTACYVDRDIPDGSFVKMGVTGLDMRENRMKRS